MEREPPATEQPAADKFGAIAYSESTRRYGYACGYDTREAAEQAARDACKADDAAVVVWAQNACCALALDLDGDAYGWAWAENAEDAKAKALANCLKHTAHAYVAVSISASGDAQKFDPPQ